MILSKIRFIFFLLNFVFTVSILIILMYLFNKQNRVLRKLWAKFQLFINNIKINITGELDKSAELLILNHQSLLDIVIYESIHPKDIAWVAKKEIQDIPWFGKILSIPNMIVINRSSKKDIIKLLDEVKLRLDSNRPIAIFPEGTRGDGTKLLKFKSGPKIIAEKYNLKIQPIILTNTRAVVDSQNYTVNGGEVGITYLESFYPSDDNWYEELKNKMEKVFINDLANNPSNR